MKCMFLPGLFSKFSRIQLFVLGGITPGFVAFAQSWDLLFCRYLLLEKDIAESARHAVK